MKRTVSYLIRKTDFADYYRIEYPTKSTLIMFKIKL